MEVPILKNTIITYDKNHTPELRVPSGSLLCFETVDCFDNQIRSEDCDTSKVDFSRANPTTGPVYVEGAERGDALKVEIFEIRPIAPGLTRVNTGMGPLGEGTAEQIWMFDCSQGYAEFKGMKIPIKPMIGTIGCTPDELIATLEIGDHGGNLDCKLIGEGATVYFPVYQEGALFSMGDVHALMGDCELSGTGLEIAARILARLTVVKQVKLPVTLLETKTSWYTMGHGADYHTALVQCSAAMQELLMKTYGWTKEEAYAYLSLVGDVEINQGCVPCGIDLSLRCGVPKVTGKPFVKE